MTNIAPTLGVGSYLHSVLVEGDVNLVADLLHLRSGQRLRSKIPGT